MTTITLTPFESRSGSSRCALALLGLALACTPVHAADPLKSVLSDLLVTSPRAEAARKDAAGAQSREKETWRRLWTPALDVTLEAGKQKFETESLSSPFLSADRAYVRGTQLLYDFGRSNRQVDESEALALQSQATSGATSDGVLLEALTAHWSAVRARLVLDYARKSESSVRNLTQMESSLVELGKGYESNVLQAKVQLAGAEARRIRAEGALEIAQARVGAVFGRQLGRVGYEEVGVPLEQYLPRSLSEAKESALANNKQLKVGLYRSQALTQRLASTKAKEFLPRLEVVAEAGQRRNWDTAIEGSRVYDQKILLRLLYNLNTGMAGLAARDGVTRDLEASVSREAEARDLVLEQVSIAWRNLQVARQNRETLANQVRIAAKFFEMATAERQLGRRSLLDVLTAEVSLINAMSDLVATEADGAIASLTLLQVTGQLGMETFQALPTAVGMPSSAVR